MKEMGSPPSSIEELGNFTVENGLLRSDYLRTGHVFGSHIGGDFGEYKPLHSSFNAKLQAICESLELNQKQGNKKKKSSKGGEGVELSFIFISNSVGE
ncbi:hypothetical protein Golob_002176 [Gossypium lobatum]|uniref:Uncharacterized protein n=1 Tax=Gossypium lobatum TaxID=34289 RepID=A0A7J8N4N6_9ROSI|nr:hypothetical protein [Gossypium lobatum]